MDAIVPVCCSQGTGQRQITELGNGRSEVGGIALATAAKVSNHSQGHMNICIFQSQLFNVLRMVCWAAQIPCAVTWQQSGKLFRIFKCAFGPTHTRCCSDLIRLPRQHGICPAVHMEH
jgi:hypothetical protein